MLFMSLIFCRQNEFHRSRQTQMSVRSLKAQRFSVLFTSIRLPVLSPLPTPPSPLSISTPSPPAPAAIYRPPTATTSLHPPTIPVLILLSHTYSFPSPLPSPATPLLLLLSLFFFILLLLWLLLLRLLLVLQYSSSSSLSSSFSSSSSISPSPLPHTPSSTFLRHPSAPHTHRPHTAHNLLLLLFHNLLPFFPPSVPSHPTDGSTRIQIADRLDRSGWKRLKSDDKTITRQSVSSASPLARQNGFYAIPSLCPTADVRLSLSLSRSLFVFVLDPSRV